MNQPVFKPDICGACGQSKTYLIPIDRGTTEITRAIAAAIRVKGINAIHPRREMEPLGLLTSNQIGNLSRPHRHGLIAKVKGEPGNWCLTSKGSRFLRGERVPKFAIVSKVTGHQIGYFEPLRLTTTIQECLKAGERWEGIDFQIVEGRILKDVPMPAMPPKVEVIEQPLFHV